MTRTYIEQRTWLLGAELRRSPRPEPALRLDELLAPGAAAQVRGDLESFSNFDAPGGFDHLRIDFNAAAVEAIRERLAVEGFHLLQMVPRISQYGYLSLTSAFQLDDTVRLEDVESRGIQLALRIDGLLPLLNGICMRLERANALEFPYHYRFGVPDALQGSAHDAYYGFGINQHVLLPSADQLEEAASALQIDPATHMEIEDLHVLSGWSVFVWAPATPQSQDAMLDRFLRVVLLDNVLAIQVTVLACGLSAATAFLGEILRDESKVSAYAARQALLVHRRIEQQMKLRERDLLELQKRYVSGQFGRSQHAELRDAYDRAEAALLSAAEGLEAARQERTAALTNVILAVVAVLGFLTVFTTAIDFGYWLPMEQRAVNPFWRRVSLLFFTMFLIAVGFFVTRLILQVSGKRSRQV